MIFTTVFGLLLTSGLATAHMQLAWPYPLHSALNHKSDPSTIDFSMTSPLESNGYHENTPWRTTATYTAGSLRLCDQRWRIVSALASYDNGATFKVIGSTMSGCPLTTELTSSSLGRGQWQGSVRLVWFNLIGKYEM